MAGGRKTLDDVQLKWTVTLPANLHQRGKIPFFCQDLTPRQLRASIINPPPLTCTFYLTLIILYLISYRSLRIHYPTCHIPIAQRVSQASHFSRAMQNSKNKLISSPLCSVSGLSQIQIQIQIQIQTHYPHHRLIMTPLPPLTP